jgi:CHAT domain-containing protein
VVAAAAPGDPERPRWLNSLGTTLYAWHMSDSDSAKLDRAISLFQQAIASSPPKNPDLPSWLTNLGSGLRRRYEQTGQLADLDSAVDLMDRAVAATPPNNPELPSRLNNLALGLRARYDHRGALVDLDSAIELLQRALAATPPNNPELPAALVNLGTSFQTRYSRNGDLADLDSAIELLQRALAATPPNTPNLPSRLTDLGNALRERYQFRHDLADLDSAIELLQRAVAAAPRDHPIPAAALSSLGFALQLRSRHSKTLDDLQAALDHYEQAIAATPRDHPALVNWLNNLGLGLIDRHKHTGDPADLDKAIDLLDRSVAATPAESPELAGRLMNLGTGLQSRHALHQRPSDLDAAIETLRKAALRGLESGVAAALMAAYRWSSSAVARRAWAEVNEACDVGLIAASRLVRTQLSRSHKETWLRAVGQLPGRAAYARAMQEDGAGAVATVEQWRAVLFAEALERDHADLERLATLGLAALVDRYRQAADQVNELEERASGDDAPAAPAEIRAAEQRAARAELEQVTAAIRNVPGYQDFQRAPTFEQVAAAATHGPVAYLIAAEPGGIALIVWPDSSVGSTPLPQLTEQALLDRFEVYAQAYDRSREDPSSWQAVLEETTHRLWDTIMGPLRIALATANRVALIPTGLLGLLPLHAAWVEDPTSPTGRRYALDDLLITFAPNGRTLREAHWTAADVAADAVLVVDEPQPVSAHRLAYATREVRSVTGAFPDTRHRVLRHEEATRDAILALLARYPVLHFTCHGFVNLTEPLKSGLLMAGDEWLTLGDLMGRRRVAARLVVLSACETAMPGAPLLDEVVSLPTGLLQAGAAGVVGSLWPVLDLSTTLLLTYFYALWRPGDGQTEEMEPAEALRRAQQLVRDSTYAQLGNAFPDIPAFTQVGMPNWRPFANPSHWASFTFTGG